MRRLLGSQPGTRTLQQMRRVNQKEIHVTAELA
jgi:hypothetical protein